MITGEALTNTLVDELNDLGLPNMAATLDSLYRSERFLKLDHLSLIAELIEPEYQDKVSKRVNNRLRHAKLIGCPQSLDDLLILKVESIYRQESHRFCLRWHLYGMD